MSNLRIFVEKIIKFRWAIALIVFVFCVIFQLHGSSIGCFSKFFPTVSKVQESVKYNVFGKDRPVRSDEWAVYTPKCFSQQFNGYRRFSNRMSEEETDSLLDYYLPSWDLATIGRPFNWGYLLFGNAYGLSFNWCMLVILLFMLSFEMFWIITNKNKTASLVGMAMVGFSPSLQWLMMPHMPIVFVYGMGLFCLGYYFFVVKKLWQQVLTAALSVIAFVGFAISIFPACQVVCGLLAVFMAGACLLRDRERFFFNRFTGVRIGLVLLAVCSILVNFLLTSFEGLSRILNSAYPGNRMTVGGECSLPCLFTNLYSALLPYSDANISNNSELANFIHFAPFFLLLYFKISKRLKNDGDRQLIFGKTIVGALVVEIIFMCAGFTPLIAKITMFRYINRMPMCYGFTATIFTVWAFLIMWQKKDIFSLKEKIIYPMVYGAFNVTLITPELLQYGRQWVLEFFRIAGDIGPWYGRILILLEISIFVLILMFSMFNLRYLAGSLITGLMIFAGFFVNPINRGIAPIVNNPISPFVQKIASKEPDAKWLVLGDGLWFVSNFILANGARVLSSTNFYSDFAKWDILNFDSKYFEQYNRYANQDFVVVDGNQYIDLIHPDHISAKINEGSLRRLGIKYIVADSVFSKSQPFIFFDKTKIFAQDGILIYRLNY